MASNTSSKLASPMNVQHSACPSLRRPLFAYLLAPLVAAVALSGCIGPFSPVPQGRDFLIPQFVLAPGQGYDWTALGTPNRTGPIVDAHFSSDGSRIAIGLGGGDVELWSSSGILLTRVVLRGVVDATCGSPWGTVRALGLGRLFTLLDHCARIYSPNGSLEFQSVFPGGVQYPDI